MTSTTATVWEGDGGATRDVHFLAPGGCGETSQPRELVYCSSRGTCTMLGWAYTMQNVVGNARGDITGEKISVCCWVDVTTGNLTIKIIGCRRLM